MPTAADRPVAAANASIGTPRASLELRAGGRSAHAVDGSADTDDDAELTDPLSVQELESGTVRVPLNYVSASQAVTVIYHGVTVRFRLHGENVVAGAIRWTPGGDTNVHSASLSLSPALSRPQASSRAVGL